MWVYSFGKRVALVLRNSACQARSAIDIIVAESLVRFAPLLARWAWEILVLGVVFLLSAGLS